MRRKRVRPTLHTYNLLVRCIRDCDFGDEDEVREAIKTIIGASSKSTILLDSGTPAEKDQVSFLDVSKLKNQLKLTFHICVGRNC